MTRGPREGGGTGRYLTCFMCAFSVFPHASVHGDAVFVVYLAFLADKIPLSKHKMCVMLKLLPDTSVMLENACAIKISLVLGLAVSKVLVASLGAVNIH